MDSAKLVMIEDLPKEEIFLDIVKFLFIGLGSNCIA